MFKKIDKRLNQAMTKGAYKAAECLKSSGKSIQDLGEKVEAKGKDLEGKAVMMEAEEKYKKSQGGAYNS